MCVSGFMAVQGWPNFDYFRAFFDFHVVPSGQYAKGRMCGLFSAGIVFATRELPMDFPNYVEVLIFSLW